MKDDEVYDSNIERLILDQDENLCLVKVNIYFETLDMLENEDVQKPLDVMVKEMNTFSNEEDGVIPYVILSQKGWPLKFGYTTDEQIEETISKENPRIGTVECYKKRISINVAQQWVKAQVDNFTNTHNYKPYLQDTIL